MKTNWKTEGLGWSVIRASFHASKHIITLKRWMNFIDCWFTGILQRYRYEEPIKPTITLSTLQYKYAPIF